MARAAVMQATPDTAADTTIELSSIVWGQPIIVSEGVQVHIALFSGSNGIDYEIYTKGEEETVHCQGKAIFSAQERPVVIDIATLKGQMKKGELTADTVSYTHLTLPTN